MNHNNSRNACEKQANTRVSFCVHYSIGGGIHQLTYEDVCRDTTWGGVSGGPGGAVKFKLGTLIFGDVYEIKDDERVKI
jgi:hypothetical protein